MASNNARNLTPGLGVAVAKRTILRKKEDGTLENWADVAHRVAMGNSLLNMDDQQEEYLLLNKHIANASLLMSGRHLQHGDESQPGRNQEVFTNCSTASSSFLTFYLLMNGSGVGRAYDDDLCLVDWANRMPEIRVVLDEAHDDFDYKTMEGKRDAQKKYPRGVWYTVPDTREGWAQAVEVLETMSYYDDTPELLVIDFSKVRPSGSPIRGMQDRPASGPAPLMKAFKNISSLRGTGMKPWESTMWVDHYLAECVLVGGARRSARIATKVWTDPDILDFISIKKGGFLWSANNSVAVDEEFWKQDTEEKNQILADITSASYHDGTGEPGFINIHKLVQKDDGLEIYGEGDFAGSQKYIVTHGLNYLKKLAKNATKKKYTQITNPCGEITLHVLGGYCVIADVVPYFAENDEEAEEAFRVATRALMRVNTMDSLYKKEVARTNRIGVGMTGIHEYAWDRFGFSFRDLIDEEKSQPFWQMLKRFKLAVDEEAESYAKRLGVNVPHTNTTIKPAGTTSKLFALSEGAHLPAMREYIRWVQFRSDDPLVEQYREKGYPVKDLITYQGSTVVGFPTQPEICKLGMGDKLVTAGNATPEEQYQWLRLLEKYWIDGSDKNTGNQVSYTLKYKPEIVSYDAYCDATVENQPTIRCASVMPQIDTLAYEYSPEQAVSKEKFMEIVSNIKDGMTEDIDLEHLRCESGSCPI